MAASLEREMENLIVDDADDADDADDDSLDCRTFFRSSFLNV